MRPMEIVVGISPADLAPWNGAEVPVRFVITERSVTMCFPHFPTLTPEILERLRIDFSEIEQSLSRLSQDILWFLLNTPEGKATRQELIDSLWPPEKTPTWGGVRKAVHSLNVTLRRLNFGYVVQGNQDGVYRLIPISW